MSKVYYVDSFSIEGTHEQFNTSLIIICDLLFAEVSTWASESSLSNSIKLINDRNLNNVYYKNLHVGKGSKKLGWIIRYLFSALQNIRFLIRVPKDTILIFPSNNILSLRILNFFNGFLNKRVVIFCHGEMEGLLGATEHSGIFAKILYKLLNNFFLNPKIKINDKLHFVVFGNKIKKNIGDIIGDEKSSHFLSIDHPYLFGHNEKEPVKVNKLNLGSVGVLNKAKGADVLLDFVDLLNSSVRKKINISSIGKIDIPIEEMRKRDIIFLPQNRTIIDREIYDSKIKELDFILFFYPVNSYKITASGAIMDSLNMEKPILALRNDYFEYLFEKFGNFGYLFDDVYQMVDTVEQIVLGNIKEKFNFKEIKNNFSPESISKQMLSEFDKIGFIKSENSK